jgi:hypothetical protein
MGLFLYSVLALFQQPPFITGHSPSTISSFTAVSSSAHQHHRVLQQNNNNNNNEFSNPRAPARRTPDDQAEAGSLSREELQTLLLGSHNIQATDRESSDSNDDEERHRFLLTIIIPTVAFVLCAAYLLQRRRRRLPQRQSPDHEETDGLVHALEEDAFSTKEDLPYRDDDSAPSHAYAEIRRNVI